MISYRNLALVTAALLVTEEASASLITFRIDARMEVGCGPCIGFEEDTGLKQGSGSFPTLNPVTARFTIDTDTAPSEPPPFTTWYEFAGPRTRLEITIGKLILNYDHFELMFFDDGDCDQIFLSSRLSGVGGRTGFNTANCSGLPTRLPDYSLDSFASSNMSAWRGTTFETFVFGPDQVTKNWWLQGAVTKVIRVPEPGALGLFALSIVGVGLLRRHGQRTVSH